jgi:opacity protein-like surface antigen
MVGLAGAGRRIRALRAAAIAFAASGCAIGGSPGRARFDADAVDPIYVPSVATASPSYATARQATVSKRESRSSSEFEPETGPFIGASYVVASIGGDFDGNSTFVASNGTETAIVPKISTGDGGRLAAGWRWTRGAVEFAYQQTRHDGEFRGLSGFDVTCHSAEVDGRFYLPSFWDRLKPSIVAGILIPWLDVKNGATGLNGAGQTVTETATYYGAGLNVGLGTEFYVTRHWSIDLLATWRWMDFSDLSGVHTDSSLDRDVYANGYVVGIGTSWTF